MEYLSICARARWPGVRLSSRGFCLHAPVSLPLSSADALVITVLKIYHNLAKPINI